MKKKLLIAAAICASLFVVMPMTNVSAAEVDAEAQGQSAQSDIAVTPCADEIVTKFRLYKKTKLCFGRFGMLK